MKRYGILNNITSPADLKGLSYDTLGVLCAALREFIVDSVSQTGGHLASNLGIVELAVALEREFDSSRDRIIYDVGHQCYVHKILTGRRDRFSTLRQYGGLSGFMKPEESITDPCITGHASDSVSVALGYVGNFFKTAASATGGVVAFASFAAAFAVAPIYLYYMLTSRFDFFAFLENNIGFMSPKMKEDSMFFARRFASIMSAFFRGQMTIAFIMGILIGLGLTLVGVKFGFLLGFAAGMLNIIPYFGTIVGLGTILPTAFFQPGGGLLTAAFALCVFVAVQMLEGYFLTPKIMGGKTGLHPTVIIFSVFFWGIALDGILGMILAIPLTAFMAALWSRFLGGGERASSPE